MRRSDQVHNRNVLFNQLDNKGSVLSRFVRSKELKKIPGIIPQRTLAQYSTNPGKTGVRQDPSCSLSSTGALASSRSSASRYLRQPRRNFGQGGTATAGSIRSGRRPQSCG